MDQELLEERAEDPRLRHPYFDGVEDMIASWVWHLADASPSREPRHQLPDGSGRRCNLLGATPDHGMLVVPYLRLNAGLPGWGIELLVAFIDLLIQDVVSRVWDRGGRTAVLAYLAPFELPPEDLEEAIVDDMVFLGRVAVEVTEEVLRQGDRLRSLAASFGR
jgi:hypothetical protein